MKVLIVSSGNSGELAPFVGEQVESLARFNILFDYYHIVGKGVFGYLRNMKALSWKINSFNPDLIHAHYGLSGFLSILTKKNIPVITTFHGNDINPIGLNSTFKPNINKLISRLTYQNSKNSIFVHKDLATKVNAKRGNYEIIPCQVNLDTFYPISKMSARADLNLSMHKKYVLFSSSFDNYIKNYPIAEEACKVFDDLEIIELKGYSRREVNLLLNACDLALITSFNEGSSQFIKEAMSCNCPVVSTDVGDAGYVFGQTEGCFLTSFEVDDIIDKIRNALEFAGNKQKTLGRQRITELRMDAENTSQRVYEVYLKTIK